MKSVDVLDTIQIVEYDPSYAQAIANMWNCSQESWGGGNRVRSFRECCTGNGERRQLEGIPRPSRE